MSATEPRRADARRNRERVIAAAEEVFAEQGVEAGIPEIAERAGVGKGTVYRNFESKDELVAAVLTLRLSRMDDDIAAAMDDADPVAALRRVLRDAAARTSALSFPTEILVPGRHPELDRVKQRLRTNMAGLFEAGQRSGGLRQDATVDELLALFGGICRALSIKGEADPERWSRHADLVLDAFRP